MKIINLVKALYKGFKNKDLEVSYSFHFRKEKGFLKNGEFIKKPVWAEINFKGYYTTYYFGMWGQRRFWLISKKELEKLQEFLKCFSSLDSDYFKVKYHTNKESLNIKDPLNIDTLTDKLDDIFDEYVILEEEIGYFKGFIENGIYVLIQYLNKTCSRPIHEAPFKGKPTHGITYIQVLINQDKKEKLSKDNVLFFEDIQNHE